jgi:NADPH:quinone reductase-like Zn-dependent oxidoreductase
VTGVCSTSNLDFVRSLGADRVIDYTITDFTKSNDTYDAIFDAVDKISRSKCKHMIKKHGTFINTGGLAKIQIEDMSFLKELIEKGKLKPVIDREYSLDQIVEAHRYVDTGRKKGNVCIYVVKKEKN